jgi:hypothetical protein
MSGINAALPSPGMLASMQTRDDVDGVRCHRIVHHVRKPAEQRASYVLVHDREGLWPPVDGSKTGVNRAEKVVT